MATKPRKGDGREDPSDTSCDTMRHTRAFPENFALRCHRVRVQLAGQPFRLRLHVRGIAIHVVDRGIGEQLGFKTLKLRSESGLCQEARSEFYPQSARIRGQ